MFNVFCTAQCTYGYCFSKKKKTNIGHEPPQHHLYFDFTLFTIYTITSGHDVILYLHWDDW